MNADSKIWMGDPASQLKDRLCRGRDAEVGKKEILDADKRR